MDKQKLFDAFEREISWNKLNTFVTKNWIDNINFRLIKLIFIYVWKCCLVGALNTSLLFSFVIDRSIISLSLEKPMFPLKGISIIFSLAFVKRKSRFIFPDSSKHLLQLCVYFFLLVVNRFCKKNSFGSKHYVSL